MCHPVKKPKLSQNEKPKLSKNDLQMYTNPSPSTNSRTKRKNYAAVVAKLLDKQVPVTAKADSACNMHCFKDNTCPGQELPHQPTTV